MELSSSPHSPSSIPVADHCLTSNRATPRHLGCNPRSATMSHIFRKRRTSSVSTQQQQQQLPFTNDEAQVDDFAVTNNSEPATIKGPVNAARRRSVTANSALPSSYKTPSRSYIHHAAHGHQGRHCKASAAPAKTDISPNRAHTILVLWRP